MTQIIVCPSCKTQIDLNKINQDKYKLELEEEFEKERAEMRKKAQNFAEQKMQEQAKKDAVEMQDLKNRLEEEAKKGLDFQKQELELRKKSRTLEEKAKNADLEMQRKLDAERNKLEKKIEAEISKRQEETIKTQVAEAQRLQADEFRKKELEFLKQQDQLKRSLDDAKRKAEQGSQQIQGDIQEEDLKQALNHAFPIDKINDVPTGIKGADLIQVVKNNLGQESGTIVWESKNTKSFENKWIMKLKEDKLKVNGNISILVSTVLPKGLTSFGMIDEVMICTPDFAIPVANLLRDKLLSISKVEKSLEGKDVKMEMLYKYLGSDSFSGKVTMMVDVFGTLKEGIDKERRAMEKNWKQREMDLIKANTAITGMYGELESLMGTTLPGSERLELDSGE